MDAAMVTALAVLAAGPVAAAAAMYGSRAAAQAQRDGVVITGYDSLAAKLVAERDKAERDEAAAVVREAAAMARVHALEAEVARLQALVERLGGTP